MIQVEAGQCDSNPDCIPRTQHDCRLHYELRHHRLERTDDMNLKNFTAIIVTALGLTACQQGNATADRLDGGNPISVAKQAAPSEASDLQTLATVFASDQGRDWTAYRSLPRINWADATHTQRQAGRYSRRATILLRGLSVREIPNGRPGSDYKVVERNEGESTLSIDGSESAVESISISKPFYSDDYLNILKTQFGASAAVSLVADQCAPGEYEEGAGSGAFFAISLGDGNKLYVEASQQDGGKYTAGFTVFKLTRARPSQAIAELSCK